MDPLVAFLFKLTFKGSIAVVTLKAARALQRKVRLGSDEQNLGRFRSAADLMNLNHVVIFDFLGDETLLADRTAERFRSLEEQNRLGMLSSSLIARLAMETSHCQTGTVCSNGATV